MCGANECNVGLLSSDDVRTGYMSGPGFTNKAIQYSIVDGLAVLEGCIVVGTAEEMEAHTAAVQAGEAEGAVDGVGITGKKYRWPGGLMPYTVESGLTNKARITKAIAHWEAKTKMRFVQRTSANASKYPNYVHFRTATGCWSYVGMRGGKQEIGLAPGCGTGATIHEIGHAFGLWHEQSREDRDKYIKVQWENIQSGRSHNFNQHISDGDDYGPYDYGSIMHYGPTAFSKNGKPTIVQLKAGPKIGNRTGLSNGDVSTIHAMYRTWHSNVNIARVFTSSHSKNAWAYVSSVGWRKVDPLTPDGVTNVFAALCEARANNRKTSLLMDGKYIHQAYLS